MPRNPGIKRKLLPLILFGIAVTSLLSVQPAQAYTVTLEQVGSNVVANGSGAFDLTGLFFFGSIGSSSFINPAFASILTGPASIRRVDVYGQITGPFNFGSGSFTSANSGTGASVGLSNFSPLFAMLFVPQGYVAGTLSSSATWSNATFASLGVTPGTYVWRWRAGANQNFTLIIGGAGVPDGGTTVSLLGCALLGLAALRRKFSC